MLRSSYGSGVTLKSNLMAGHPTRSKGWSNYEGLAIPPCNDYYVRKPSRTLILPWLYVYSIVERDGKNLLQKKKKVASDLSLHDEIIAFVKYMKPTKREVEIRQDLVNRFTKLLSSFEVDAFAPEPVGSYVTGLYLSTSDIDMVIIPHLITSSKDVLRRIHDKLILMPSPQFHKEVKSVLQASVPLITITDAKTGIAIDLTTEFTHSRAATRAVSEWLKRDEALGHKAIIKMLVTVVKTFLDIRRCGSTYTGGVNSYVLVWMVVAWVKLELPKMHSQPRAVYSADVDSISSALSSVRLSDSHVPDYGKILIAFLKFYGQEFDYTRTKIVVSPEPRYAYKYPDSQPYLLTIADPANSLIDIGSKAYAIKHVVASFKEAHTELQLLEHNRVSGSVGEEGILGKVLGGDFLRYWVDRFKLQ